MLSREFFDFEFVDREYERDRINTYSDFNRTLDYNVLWISGNRGVGKSFLLRDSSEQMAKSGICPIYVDTNTKEIFQNNYINILIEELEKHNSERFSAFIKKHYKVISNVMSITTDALSDLAGKPYNKLAQSIPNLINSIFQNHSNKDESYASVVLKYIYKLTENEKNVVIMLDNFSRIDESSLDVLSQIIRQCEFNHNIRFIVCTTYEDLVLRGDIKDILVTALSIKKIDVKKFDNNSFFFRMIDGKIKLTEQNISLIQQAFQLCEGYPQRYKTLLINVSERDGIIFGTPGKAEIVENIFREVLVQEGCDLDINKLSRLQREILQIIYLWGYPLKYSTFIEFVYKNEPFITIKSIDNNLISDEIEALLNTDLLMLSDNGEKEISLGHDSISLACAVYFKDKARISYIHHMIASFIMGCTENEKEQIRNVDACLAYHSYKCNMEGWLDINYSYLKKLYYNRSYIEAGDVSSRCVEKVGEFNFEQAILIADCEKQSGRFDEAISILEQIDISKSNKNDKYNYYILLTDLYRCTNKVENALSTLGCAEELISDNIEKNLEVLSRKQCILFVSPGGFEKAKALFTRIVNTYSDILSSQMLRVYSSAMDYGEGDFSLKYLNKGLYIAKETNNKIYEAKFQNNIAFECFRSGEYDEAEKLYHESIDILDIYQPHELSTPLSNLAVIRMVQKRWDDAMSFIMDSIICNKSMYIKNILLVNRMLCYYHMGNRGWKEIFEELENFVSVTHHVDDKIYKKIYLNLAYISLMEHKYEQANKLLNSYEPYSYSEWEQGLYRYNHFKNKANNEPFQTPPPNSTYKYYYGIPFEPWIVNFTHD